MCGVMLCGRGDKHCGGKLALPKGMSMSKPIEVVQGGEFSQKVDRSDASEVTVDVKGPSRNGGLRAAIRGGSLTISGKLRNPGMHEITIVEKRVTKVTINVIKAKPLLDTPVLDVFMGRRVRADPPVDPSLGQ